MEAERCNASACSDGMVGDGTCNAVCLDRSCNWWVTALQLVVRWWNRFCLIVPFKFVVGIVVTPRPSSVVNFVDNYLEMRSLHDGTIVTRQIPKILTGFSLILVSFPKHTHTILHQGRRRLLQRVPQRGGGCSEHVRQNYMLLLEPGLREPDIPPRPLCQGLSPSHVITTKLAPTHSSVESSSGQARAAW